MVDPQAIVRAQVKDIIKDKTNESHTLSRQLARVAEIRFNIEERNFQEALMGMLDFITRQTVGRDYTPDDFTRLLNTTNHEGTTIRELFKSIPRG